MKTALIPCILLFLAGCAGAPFTTTSDFDREINYSAYQTYAWVSENPMVIPEGSTTQPSPLLERRIMDMIESQLQAKGFAIQEDAGSVDFVVGFTVGTREQLSVYSYPTPVGFNTWNYPYGWGPGPMFYTETTRTTQYTEGTLAIDIFDVEKLRPVWHGKAQGVVRERSQDEQRAILAQAIEEILATFPPL